MSPFITFMDTNRAGEMQYYILQRAYPHYVGLIENMPRLDQPYQAPISGHHIYITFNGILRGNFVPASEQYEREIGAVFEAMAAWFYENRVLKEPKRYKKFAIPV